MNQIVRLLSEVLVSGKGCPLCGKHKSDKARTCRICINEIGADATKAVDAVAEATCDALLGSTMANAGEVVRGTVWGPFLANTRIDLDAKFYPAKGDIGSYWHCKRGVPGGYVSIFIFEGGNVRQGDTVCGLTELKVKFVPTRASNGKDKEPVHYFRVQVVPGVKSDVKIAVLEPQNIERLANDYLPAMTLRTENYGAAVGFLPEKAKSDEDEET